MTNRFGASGGVAARQLLIRSVRSSTSNTSASKPTAKLLTCTTAKAGRAAICRVASTSAVGAVASLTLTRSSLTASQLKPANSRVATAKPPTAIRPSLTSLLAAISKAAKPSTPTPKTVSDAGLSPPTSRRITRSGGTCANCSTGGRPKASNRVRPMPMPKITGIGPAAGKSASTNPASSATKP